MVAWGGVVARCDYMSGTPASGFVSTADDVLKISVVRGVGGVCEMCMCLARGRVEKVSCVWAWALPIV